MLQMRCAQSVIAVVLAQLEKLLVRQSDERVQLWGNGVHRQ